jgi:hypothetical protein
MKYLAILLFLVSCADTSKLDNEIKELNESTRGLEFSRFTLDCLIEIDDTPYLRHQGEKLNLPRTKEVALLLIDAYLYKCIRAKYDRLML